MLKISNLNKFYDKQKAVDDVSLELPEGQIMGLLGRNGAGKTTTIKMMLGLIEKDQGDITWRGVPFNRKDVKIGYLPEERGLYPKAKIFEQLMYFGRLEGMDKKTIEKEIDRWLERFEITEYKYKLASELSKGNQQKIQLVATLLHDPELIILDEPFSGLDPVNANLLGDIIFEENKKQKTMILSSHRMEQIESFCENVVMMKQGKIVVSGKLQNIKDEYGFKNLVVSFYPEYLSKLDALDLGFEIQGSKLQKKVKDEKEGLSLLGRLSEAGIGIRNFSMLEPSLHQIFVEKVGDNK